MPTDPRPLRDRLRSRIGALVVDNMFNGLATVGRLHPRARPARHNVEVLRDIAYSPSGLPEHRLDIYRPTAPKPGSPLPVVLYIHGGGFRILSKDTHWLMGLAFAREGYLVVNINYRLAPQNPFPAAIVDTCDAFGWVVRNIRSFGGDLDRLAFAGESAGANLATALTLATCYPRPEPWARAAFDLGVTPRATVAACGMLQVSDVARFARRKPLSSWLNDRLMEVSRAYLHGVAPSLDGTLDLADPLILLERGDAPARPLPPFFAPVGTADPLLDDTRRLQIALDRLGVVCRSRYYPGEVHAFHAMIFRKNARRCWRDIYAFLGEHIPR
ncbi:MAG: alpha/beta hydrolase [Myxococcales bacterium]|nr:alpha/beta hydrolase [Myxococcales bacterium]